MIGGLRQAQRYTEWGPRHIHAEAGLFLDCLQVTSWISTGPPFTIEPCTVPATQQPFYGPAWSRVEKGFWIATVLGCTRMRRTLIPGPVQAAPGNPGHHVHVDVTDIMCRQHIDKEGNSPPGLGSRRGERRGGGGGCVTGRWWAHGTSKQAHTGEIMCRQHVEAL